MNIYVVCSVRNASPELRRELEQYAAGLEAAGNKVHLPHRDTDQDGTGWEICRQNGAACAAADEVHIFFDPASTGSHFDLGIAWALGKKIVVAKNVEYGPGKSFARLVDEWGRNSPPKRARPEPPAEEPDAPMTFARHRELTASDCEAVAGFLSDLASEVREGNMGAFERFWIEGGTEEGDARMLEIRERIACRFMWRQERVEKKGGKTCACLICKKPVQGYEPEFCCQDIECGCHGMPVNPCVCSDACEKALMDGIGKEFEQRRIDAGIPLWDGRHVCTAENPWKPSMGRATHPDAREEGDQKAGWPGGDVQGYRCPHCGLRFEQELPQ